MVTIFPFSSCFLLVPPRLTHRFAWISTLIAPSGDFGAQIGFHIAAFRGTVDLAKTRKKHGKKLEHDGFFLKKTGQKETQNTCFTSYTSFNISVNVQRTYPYWIRPSIHVVHRRWSFQLRIGDFCLMELQVVRWFPHKPHANRVCKNGHTRLKHLTTKRYKTPQNTTKICENPLLPASLSWAVHPQCSAGQWPQCAPGACARHTTGPPLLPRWASLNWHQDVFEFVKPGTFQNSWNVWKIQPFKWMKCGLFDFKRVRQEPNWNWSGVQIFLHVLQPKNRSTCIGQHELQTTLDWLITVRKNTYRRTIQCDAITQTKLDRRLDAASAKTSRFSSPKRSSNERAPLSPLQEEQRKKQRADSIKKHDGHLQLHTTLFYFMPACTNLGSGWFPEHSLPVLGPAPPFARLSRAPAIPALRAQTNHARDSTTTPRWAEQNAVTQGNATTNAHNANANQCGLYSAFPEVHILAQRPWQNHRHRPLNLAATILSALIVSNSCTG